MLNEIYKDKSVAKILKEGPLGPFLEKLLSNFLDKGYSRKTIRSRFGVIVKLSKWLIAHNIELCNFDENQFNNFVNYRSKQTNITRRGEMVTLKALIHLLQKNGIILKPKQEPKSEHKNKEVENTLEEFTKYLKNERGLASSTISRYNHYTRFFLDELFGTTPISIDKITIENINSFILKEFDLKNFGLLISIIDSLRSFFRFLFIYKKIPTNIAAAIQKYPDFKNNRLPYFLTSEELKHLLNTCNGKTDKQKRNYAILLLLSRLGLRACEIIRLTLDDVDWKNGEIIINGKYNKKSRLPLLNDVGESLARYIKNTRPMHKSRQIFLSCKPPIKPLKNSTAISCIVTRALKRTNLEPLKKGAHLLRHTFATESLRKGISLSDIGQILRHQQIDTTAIYAKVDFAKLQLITKSWPEKSFLEAEK